MKYVRKTNYNITENFLENLLLDRKIIIDDKDFKKAFLYPTENNLHDPALLDHVEEGY
jgi:hypothetical protein